MRWRLTLAFVCLALFVVGGAAVVRTAALGDSVRAAEIVHLTDHARVAAEVIDDAELSGLSIDQRLVDRLAPEGSEITVERADAASLSARGEGFTDASVPDATAVEETVGDVTVSIKQAPDVLAELTNQELRSLYALLGVLALLSGLLSWWLASWLTRPLRALASSSSQLARGRFDIALPKSRIPEVNLISRSLRSNATRLEQTVSRDREFYHHASHVLRTPLTGMRLELEHLAGRDDVDQDTRDVAQRCVRDIEKLDSTVAELLGMARNRSADADSEISLLALGSQVAQHWRARLPESREVKAYVDGGPEVTLTPGPIEQLLDSVLTDVTEYGSGDVVLRFNGQGEHVRVTIRSGGPARPGSSKRPGSAAARTMAESLGGRFTGEATEGQLEILLPLR